LLENQDKNKGGQSQSPSSGISDKDL